jgi:hypothetical protein
VFDVEKNDFISFEKKVNLEELFRNIIMGTVRRLRKRYRKKCRIFKYYASILGELKAKKRRGSRGRAIDIHKHLQKSSKKTYVPREFFKLP